MNRHGYSTGVTFFRVDVVTPSNPPQLPALSLKQPSKLLAGDVLHTAISKTLSFSVSLTSFTSTDRQASTAS